MLKTKAATIFDRTLLALFTVACVVLALDVVLISLDVTMRYILMKPIIWAIEVVTMSLIFITFLSTAWVLKKDRHVKLDLALKLLSPRDQAIVRMITSVFGALMCLVVTWYAGGLAWDLFQSGEAYYTALQAPKAPLVAIIPIGSFLLSIQFLRTSYDCFRSWRQCVMKKTVVVESEF